MQEIWTTMVSTNILTVIYTWWPWTRNEGLNCADSHVTKVVTSAKLIILRNFSVNQGRRCVWTRNARLDFTKGPGINPKLITVVAYFNTANEHRVTPILQRKGRRWLWIRNARLNPTKSPRLHTKLITVVV